MKTPYRLYLKLLKYSRRYVPAFLLCTLAGGITVFLIFSSAGILLKEAAALTQNASAPDISELLLYLSVIVVFSLLSGFSRTGFTYIEQKLQLLLRREMLKSYMKTDEKHAALFPPTEVLNRLTVDLSSCTPALGYYMSGFVLQPMLSGLFSVIMLCMIDWRIALLCLLCTALNFLFSRFLLNHLRRIKQAIVKNQSETSAFIQDCTEKNIEIRSFALYPYFKEELEKKLNTVKKKINSFETENGLRIQLTVFSGDCLTIICLLILGALLASASIIRFADIMVAIPLSDQIGQMMSAFGNFSAVIKQTVPSLERVFEIIGLPSEDDEFCTRGKDNDFYNMTASGNSTDCTNMPISGGVTFDNVSFSYDKTPVLNNVSFTVRPGEKAAFVGESGCGKSTLIKLLLGLYKPDKGTIAADKKLLAHCSLKDWRQSFAYLSQDISVFHRTVAENIALKTMNHTTEISSDIRQAAKAADADDFIRAKSDGYSFIPSEDNGSFSGGQLQRIALARCLYKNAPVILMDEPTSALDAASEAAVIKTIHHITGSHTVIVVTHRLRLTKNFDCLYVMEKGKIIERGSHDELIKKGGVYASLWQAQCGLK